MHRMFEGMQLEDWTRLSGLTSLTLHAKRQGSYHLTLAAVLPRLTTLRSLVLTYWWPLAAAASERCICWPMI